ncbi:hypothetical protein ACJX0J_028634, partial [Zea mays]
MIHILQSPGKQQPTNIEVVKQKIAAVEVQITNNVARPVENGNVGMYEVTPRQDDGDYPWRINQMAMIVDLLALTGSIYIWLLVCLVLVYVAVHVLIATHIHMDKGFLSQYCFLLIAYSAGSSRKARESIYLIVIAVAVLIALAQKIQDFSLCVCTSLIVV